MGHTDVGLPGHRRQKIAVFDFKKLADHLQGPVDLFIDRFGRGSDERERNIGDHLLKPVLLFSFLGDFLLLPCQSQQPGAKNANDKRYQPGSPKIIFRPLVQSSQNFRFIDPYHDCQRVVGHHPITVNPFDPVHHADFSKTAGTAACGDIPHQQSRSQVLPNCRIFACLTGPHNAVKPHQGHNRVFPHVNLAVKFRKIEWVDRNDYNAGQRSVRFIRPPGHLNRPLARRTPKHWFTDEQITLVHS